MIVSTTGEEIQHITFLAKYSCYMQFLLDTLDLDR